MSTNVTDLLRETYRPKAALMVFSNDDSITKKYYMETRPVKPDGTLGAARPVSREFIKALVKNFKEKDERTPHGALPPTLLYADSTMGAEHYVWWNPPQKRTLYFTEDIPLEDGEYMMPGVIYSVRGESLSVFAFKGKRPQKNAALYYGPFYNYYDDGTMCLGNARHDLPANPTWNDVLEHWETLFWKSENSHMMTDPMEKGHNLNVILKEMKEAKEFPISYLKPFCKSLQFLL